MHLDHFGTFVRHFGHDQFTFDPMFRGRSHHGFCHSQIRSLFCPLSKNVTTGPSRNGHYCRSSTTQIGTRCTSALCGFNHGIQILVDFSSALGLMHSVLDGPFQIVQVAHAQGQYQPGGTANVKGSVGTRDFRFQNSSGVGRFANKVGNEHDQLHSSWTRNPFCFPSSSIVDTNLDTAVDCWSNIVRMPLDSTSNLQQGFTAPTGQSMAREYQSSNDPRHNGRTGRSQPSGKGNATHNVIFEGGHFLVGRVKGRLAAHHQKVALVGWHFFGSFSFSRDFKLVAPFHRHLAPQIDGHSNGIVTRPHIGRRGRHSHRDGSSWHAIIFFDGRPRRHETSHFFFVIVRKDEAVGAHHGRRCRIFKNHGRAILPQRLFVLQVVSFQFVVALVFIIRRR
mmetsp:Transcript_16017/g.37794  ORF Transcript_16017/g.37794 Transcript_16017/m.37794 type:complete len:393 (-) Transcript_16017:268-1446(-)